MNKVDLWPEEKDGPVDTAKVLASGTAEEAEDLGYQGKSLRKGRQTRKPTISIARKLCDPGRALPSISGELARLEMEEFGAPSIRARPPCPVTPAALSAPTAPETEVNLEDLFKGTPPPLDETDFLIPVPTTTQPSPMNEWGRFIPWEFLSTTSSVRSTNPCLRDHPIFFHLDLSTTFKPEWVLQPTYSSSFRTTVSQKLRSSSGHPVWTSSSRALGVRTKETTCKSPNYSESNKPHLQKGDATLKTLQGAPNIKTFLNMKPWKMRNKPQTSFTRQNNSKAFQGKTPTQSKNKTVNPWKETRALTRATGQRGKTEEIPKINNPQDVVLLVRIKHPKRNTTMPSSSDVVLLPLTPDPKKTLVEYNLTMLELELKKPCEEKNATLKILQRTPNPKICFDSGHGKVVFNVSLEIPPIYPLANSAKSTTSSDCKAQVIYLITTANTTDVIKQEPDPHRRLQTTSCATKNL